MVVKRTRRLSMLISDEEWTMLQAAADRRGLTASDWVRQQIREADGGERPPKRPKPKR
jgi:uncharacterized protein (DUF1778 family)